MTERELDMAKRLEDFITQSEDQNAMLQAEVMELKKLLAVKEEQLASATFRYNRITIKHYPADDTTYTSLFISLLIFYSVFLIDIFNLLFILSFSHCFFGKSFIYWP